MNALGNQDVFTVENMTADEISVIDCGISTGDFEVVNISPTKHGLCGWTCFFSSHELC